MVLFSLPFLATLAVSSIDPLWNWTCEAGMLLLAAIVAVRFRRQRVDSKGLIPLLAIGLWGFGQLAFGSTVYRYATLDAALLWLALASLAYSAAAVFSRRRRRDDWLRWFCWASVGVALVSVLAYHTSPGKILWTLSSVYPDNWGPFPSRNNFAQFLELSFPVAMYRFNQVASSGARDPHARAEALWVAGLAPAVLFACGIASASRAGAAILVLEALGTGILLSRGRDVRNAKQQFALIAGTVCLSLLLGAGTLLHRLHESDPLAARREIFRSTWNMARNRPWTGYGLGTFRYVYPEFAVFDAGSRVEHAHDDWLEWGAEGGVFFAAAWVFLLISVAPRAFGSIWGVGVLGVFAHAAVDYPFARLGITAWLFVLLGGLLSLEGGGTRMWSGTQEEAFL